MHILSTNKNKLILLLLLIVGTSVVVIYFNNSKDNNSINYGDNFVLQNYIDDDGNVVNSAIVIYDENFKSIKSSKILDEVYDRVDQVDMNQDTVDSGEIHLILYNSEKEVNKKVIINLKNNELLLQESNENPKIEEDLQIGVGYNDTDILLELAKKDYYKVIKDPNFIDNGMYYTLVDFEQLSNYVK